LQLILHLIRFRHHLLKAVNLNRICRMLLLCLHNITLARMEQALFSGLFTLQVSVFEHLGDVEADPLPQVSLIYIFELLPLRRRELFFLLISFLALLQ
jgi:hypothetical protein